MIVSKGSKKNYIYEKISKVDKVILFLLGLYFVLFPIYLRSSGQAQVANLLLVLIMALYVIKSNFVFKYNKDNYNVMIISILLLFWIIIVNLIWAIIMQSSDSFLSSILFYLYNTLVFIFSMFILNEYRRRLLKIIYIGVYISLVIQAIFIIYEGGFSGARVVGTFNNPNQLGYYSILSSALIIVISEKVQLSNKVFVTALILSLGLVLVSLSNAAIIAWFVQLFAYVLLKSTDKKKTRKKIVFTGFLLIVVLSTMNSSTITNSILYKSVESRLIKTDEKVASLSTDRGYNRIMEYPEYWLFGAGEGAYSRFDGYGGEFHSTFGNIQVSYGFMGTIIFVYLLFTILKASKFKYVFIVASILLYGYSHNGIRSSLFWILLAIISSYIDCNSNRDRLEQFNTKLRR